MPREMSDERTDNKDVDDFDLTKHYFVESMQKQGIPD